MNIEELKQKLDEATKKSNKRIPIKIIARNNFGGIILDRFRINFYPINNTIEFIEEKK